MQKVVARPLDKGMGEGVAARTILRTNSEGVRETWGDVAERVAAGSVSLGGAAPGEREGLEEVIAKGIVLLSGRHLQHGDADQHKRNLELFSNCSTAATSFLQFYLLLNGSGVGRSYDDALMLVDWSLAPHVIPVIDRNHGDWAKAQWFDTDEHIERTFLTPETAKAMWPAATVFRVPDSREGWAKALEQVETTAYLRGSVGLNPGKLILDFSDVRPEGSPIGGMQGRPSSGPLPLMRAFAQLNGLTGRYTERWEQTIRIDHLFADVVRVGGSRRAARIAVKHWKDEGILRFIDIKKQGDLWSANNSVGVDEEFWAALDAGDEWATTVWNAVLHAQYDHGTGEPGFLNLHKLHTDLEGLGAPEYALGEYAQSDRYEMDSHGTVRYLSELTTAVKEMPYPYIVNPCAEIPLNSLGAYCVIGDVAPFHAETDEEIFASLALATRALMRTNLMPALYQTEVTRTNRIGVGLTGIHEFAWSRFGLTFRDLLDERGKGADFWDFIDQMRQTVEDIASEYAEELNVNVPHTFTTVKPAGTTSKLFGLTEGAHLPAMAYYMRWVQFKQGDPVVEEYRSKGYPVMDTIPKGTTGAGYTGTALVGFPTKPTISTLGMPEVVTANEATLEEQYEWVRLIEKYWLGENGNQVSYTLKYNREDLSFEAYEALMRTNQRTVRCLSVMPVDDWRVAKAKYGYVPEEPLTAEAYEAEVKYIEQMEQYVSMDELACAGGACPI